MVSDGLTSHTLNQLVKLIMVPATISVSEGFLMFRENPVFPVSPSTLRAANLNSFFTRWHMTYSTTILIFSSSNLSRWSCNRATACFTCCSFSIAPPKNSETRTRCTLVSGGVVSFCT